MTQQDKERYRYAMEVLGVGVILARSPQAKGRVERLFKMLQDRLKKELGRGSATLERANDYLWHSYLAAHNARFAVVVQEVHNAHRPVPARAEQAAVFCTREPRVVQEDYTVQHQRTTYQ